MAAGDDIDKAGKELEKRKVLEFVMRAAKLMHEKHIRLGEQTREWIRDEEMHCARQFEAMKRQLQKRSWSERRFAVCLTLPLILLSLRLIIERLFETRLQLLVSTRKGADAYERIEADVSNLFDPYGYFRQMSIFQSSSEAMALLPRIRRREGIGVYTRSQSISPALRSSLSERSISPETRRLFYRAGD